MCRCDGFDTISIIFILVLLQPYVHNSHIYLYTQYHIQVLHSQPCTCGAVVGPWWGREVGPGPWAHGPIGPWAPWAPCRPWSSYTLLILFVYVSYICVEFVSKYKYLAPVGIQNGHSPKHNSWPKPIPLFFVLYLASDNWPLVVWRAHPSGNTQLTSITYKKTEIREKKNKNM